MKPTALFSNESLESLMNMPVPPKELRPPAEAPVSYVCSGKHIDVLSILQHLPVSSRFGCEISP